ncbi:MAG: efflux RND transporter permease subunit [Alsobacter sp.]
MAWLDRFVQRPVLAIVVSLLILLVGAQGLLNLPVRQFPRVQETTITVMTLYVGASPQLMQSFVTAPVAKAVSSAEGVDYVTSKSELGKSTVSVRMRLDADPNAALAEISAKVQAIRANLPQEAYDPVVVKGTGQTFALMYLNFSSTELSLEALTEYLTHVVQPNFAMLDGVASVDLLGGRSVAMRVWVDPIRLAARSITAGDVVAAIRKSNFLAAPGVARNEYVAFSLEMQTTLQTPAAFGALPLVSQGDNVVRLRDVADVEMAPVTTDFSVQLNGQYGTFLGVVPTPSANPLQVAEAVRNAAEALRPTLPKGMNVQVVLDGSQSIAASIREVYKTIAEAVLIVVLVIFLVLGSARSVLIPVITIPVSLIGVCFVLAVLGYSINLLTLLAMVLAIGLVVDDAIVVVENVHRHIDEGMPPTQAALAGLREISGPVVSMTITLAAVYAPIGFVSGLTGTLFREFAFTLAGAVIVSGIVALTLSPMMCAHLLVRTTEAGRLSKLTSRALGRVERAYGRALAIALDQRLLTVAAVAAMMATTALMFAKTPSELAPNEDQSMVMGFVAGPPYATATYTRSFAASFENLRDRIPEVKDSFLIVWGGQGFLGIKLQDWQDRDRSATAVTKDIQKILDSNPGLQAFVWSPGSLPGTSGGTSVQLVLRSTDAPEQVYEVAESIRKQAQVSGLFTGVQNSLSYEQPRARIIVDRDFAASLGVPVSDIGATLTALVGAAPISKIDRESRGYDVIMQVRQENRLNPDLLSQFYVRSASGAMVPLSALVRVETGASTSSIEQFNQLNAAIISASPVAGVTSSEALRSLRDIAAPLLPDRFYLDLAGQSRLEKQEGRSIGLVFGLALLMIYLVLCVQFESFRDPLIIIMAVPLSLFGAMIALNLGAATLNIYTQVGLITLVGLITKHGILIVEFANAERARGADRRAAVERAAVIRLRPILMTTAAMVLGVVPLILASGAGANARFSMGVVIAAGMSVGTLFTLFVLPAFYVMLSADRPRAASVVPTGEAEAQGVTRLHPADTGDHRPEVAGPPVRRRGSAAMGRVSDQEA